MNSITKQFQWLNQKAVNDNTKQMTQEKHNQHELHAFDSIAIS